MACPQLSAATKTTSIGDGTATPANPFSLSATSPKTTPTLTLKSSISAPLTRPGSWITSITTTSGCAFASVPTPPTGLSSSSGTDATSRRQALDLVVQTGASSNLHVQN